MKLTIGIPFYNPGEYFFDSIKSILLQSFNDFELILIDDGSSDDSLTVAKSFSDPRIVVVSDNLNLGLPARLNQIVNLSRGEYIARMDADDLVSLERLVKQVQFLDENPDIDIVSTGICSISNNCEFMSVRIPKFTKRLDLNLDDGIKGATGLHTQLLWLENLGAYGIVMMNQLS
ncbi:glycosyltransferase family A protein [Vibrio sp. M60_M31a]